jgi:hypothetical protein
MASRGTWLIAAAASAITCSSASGIVLYDNTTNFSGQLATLSGNQWADDLHMQQGFIVNEIVFGYDANGAGSGPGATAATIRFYANDASNSIWPGGGAPLLFERTVTFGSQSDGLFTLVLSQAVQLPKNVWFSIKFNHFNGSIPLYESATFGSSDDVLVRGSGSFWNGSAPAAYFPAGRNTFPIRRGYLEAPAPGAAASLIGASTLLMGFRPRRRKTIAI